MLKYIKELSCPQCGAPAYCDSVQIDSRGKVIIHSNGELFETRKFSCKLVLEYIPNFRKTQQTSPCSNSKEVQEEIHNTKLLFELVNFQINSANVSEKIKERFRYALRALT